MKYILVNKFQINRVGVLYFSVWKYFSYPSVTDVRRERADIDLERRFHQFIWDTIVTYVENIKGIISG